MSGGKLNPVVCDSRMLPTNETCAFPTFFLFGSLEHSPFASEPLTPKNFLQQTVAETSASGRDMKDQTCASGRLHRDSTRNRPDWGTFGLHDVFRSSGHNTHIMSWGSSASRVQRTKFHCWLCDDLDPSCSCAVTRGPVLARG